MLYAAMLQAFGNEIAALNRGLPTITVADVWRELNKLLASMDFDEIDEHQLFLDWQIEHHLLHGRLDQAAEIEDAQVFYRRLKKLVLDKLAQAS